MRRLQNEGDKKSAYLCLMLENCFNLVLLFSASKTSVKSVNVLFVFNCFSVEKWNHFVNSFLCLFFHIFLGCLAVIIYHNLSFSNSQVKRSNSTYHYLQKWKVYGRSKTFSSQLGRFTYCELGACIFKTHTTNVEILGPDETMMCWWAVWRGGVWAYNFYTLDIPHNLPWSPSFHHPRRWA